MQTASSQTSSPRIVWQPQINKKNPSKAHPQQLLVDCPLPVIFYGGARGGGKTDGGLGKVAIDCSRYPGRNVVYFREEVTQADDLIERAKEIYEPLGAVYRIQQKQFNFKNGSRVRFRGLQTIDDAKKYQGQNIDLAIVEEAGNYPDPAPIFTLFGALRSAKGYPCQLILNGNPAGAGNHWIKSTFYDPYPKGNKILNIKINQGTVRGIFIPAKVTDNYALLENDPTYIDRLKLVGSPALVRAWLEGDFEAIEGAFFTLTEKNFCLPFNIPEHWRRYIGTDWGYRDPFVATFIAVSSGFDDEGNPHHIPKGKLVVYRCISKSGVDNVDQADIVYNSCKFEKISRAALDPTCWSHQGQKSIAEQINTRLNEINSDWYYQEAINDRVGGWSLLQQLINTGQLLIFNNLVNLIAPLQTLPVSKNNAEDADTKANDHAPDSLRYATMQYFQDSVYSAQQNDIGEPLSSGVNLAALIKRVKQSKGARI